MNPERWQRIKQLYNSALELESGRRDAFLKEVCAGDESLRQEVERLLVQQAGAEEVLGAPALEFAARALAQSQDACPDANLVGRALLHYQVTGKIGAGGMGVVYRAQDTHLNRSVAIKVLPDVFVEDAERMARFEREARLLATLNHPNIASIHGLEKQEGRSFLVLELVEGPTLEERLRKGPIPVDDALDICRQIAEGLEAAHEKGIIHRDLKPANVKVTPEGKVKILDFGLARVLRDQAATSDIAHSPTITDEMTRPGIVLGTAAYMSPEQAKGKTVDKRADIWAFGCVLYECLTAKRAFRGDSIAEVMARILEAEPDWSQLPANTPPVVRSLLRQCLQKDPNIRLHDIADSRVQIFDRISEPAEVVPVSHRLSLMWILAIGAAILVIGLLSGMLVIKYYKPATLPMSRPVVRSPVRLEPAHQLAGRCWSPPYGFDQPTRTAMAISSDGRFIVYSAIAKNPGPEDEPQLYLRRTDQLVAKPIPGTEGGICPFLSPDDRWVGFSARGKLMKVSIDGGVPMPLCKDADTLGASWGPDNSIVFTPDGESGLSRVSADGGEPEVLTSPDKANEAASHRLPHWLPNGKGVLFTIMHQWYDAHPRVALLDPKTRKWKVLIEDAADARYASTGHLVFLRQGTLMAVPFDLEKLQLTGQSVPTISNVMQAINIAYTTWGTAAGQFSVSDSGWLVYVPGGIVPDCQNSLVWIDQKGAAQPAAPLKAPFYGPRLSPDGQRIAYATLGRDWRVWVYDLNRGNASLLTREGKATHVAWTPDGKRVVFEWCSSGQFNLYWQPADGSQPMERLTTSEYSQDPGSFSPDAATLALVEWNNPVTSADILLLDLRTRRVTPFLKSRAFEGYPEFSPDGRWLAYVSNESGRSEVYVQPFPGPGGKWLISLDGGTEPLWARNGKQLFYLGGDNEQVWVADVKTDGGFFASKPRLLFKAPGFLWAWPCRGWDIWPDGRRFLRVKMEERKAQPVTEMILVQNWLEELKRLVPVK